MKLSVKLPWDILSTLTQSPADVMKLSVKLPRDIFSTLTPTPTLSRTSLSSKTLGEGFEDR